jgi:hypothetical protein
MRLSVILSVVLAAGAEYALLPEPEIKERALAAIMAAFVADAAAMPL